MESQILKFENTNVRTNIIDDTAWFCGKDVCQILGITKYRDMMQNLDDDERMTVSTDTLGGPQNMTFINESGVYECVFRSRHPEAKKFKKWIKTDVLPSIRKTGEYKLKDSEYYKTKGKQIEFNLFKDAHDFMKGLGEDRYASICLDNIKNLISETDNIKLIEDKTRLSSISERIYNDYKRKLTAQQHNELISLGRIIKKEYTTKNNKEPQKCLKYCNGQQSYINVYKISDFTDWIDTAIKEFYDWI